MTTQTTSPIIQSLFQQASQPLPAPTSSPMNTIAMLAQLGALGSPTVATGGSGVMGALGGGVLSPIKGTGAAAKLAAQAAQIAGVPVAWAHDPKFWYETEHESGLYPTGTWQDIVKAAHADNPTSSAYGIGQFLDATRQTYGLALNASPLQQLVAMFKYIRDRYQTPEGAFQHRMQTGWY